MKTTLALLALAALSACASAPASNRVDWRCDQGRAFSLRYNGAGAAEVFAAGRTYALPAAQSGSGARYSDGQVEYWEHGGEATLNNAFGGPYTNCRRS